MPRAQDTRRLRKFAATVAELMKGPKTRSDLVRATGTHFSTLAYHIETLHEEGLVWYSTAPHPSAPKGYGVLVVHWQEQPFAKGDEITMPLNGARKIDAKKEPQYRPASSVFDLALSINE
jgi:hypothetical protein